MKKLLFTLSALAALTLLAPATGSAYDNIMAIIVEDPATADASAPLDSILEDDGVAAHIVNFYLVLMNPTDTALYGYEFSVDMGDGPGVLMTPILYGGSPLNVSSSPNFIVGLGTPLPTVADGFTHIATFPVYYLVPPLPVIITLNSADPYSLEDYPDLPVLLISGGLMVPAGTSTAAGSPTACINCDLIVASEETSWDRMKAMYR